MKNKNVEYFVDYLSAGRYGLMEINNAKQIKIIMTSASPSTLINLGYFDLGIKSFISVSPVVSSILESETIESSSTSKMNFKNEYSSNYKKYTVQNSNNDLTDIIEEIIKNLINFNKKPKY
jgi:hypothetical protein